MITIEITTEHIRLDQLLKLANLVAGGGEAKADSGTEVAGASSFTDGANANPAPAATSSPAANATAFQGVRRGASSRGAARNAAAMAFAVGKRAWGALAMACCTTASSAGGASGQDGSSPQIAAKSSIADSALKGGSPVRHT